MTNMYLANIINNDILLSIVISSICTLVIYLDHKRTNIIYNYTNYIKYIILISISVYIGLYLQKIKIPIKESSIKIGEPNF